MLDEGRPGARGREAREGGRRAVQLDQQHGAVLGRGLQLCERPLECPQLREHVPLRPRLVGRHQVLERLLDHEQRLPGLDERRHGVDLLLELPRGVGGTRDRPQQVDDVAQEVEARDTAVAVGLQPLPGGRPRRRAVGLEQVQDLAPAVAPQLALQLVQQPLRGVGAEEAQHRAQEVVALRPLRQLADALLGQVLVAGSSHRLDERGLHLAFRDHLVRELEHLQRAAVRAFVELLDRGVDHLAEAPARLGRLVGERDHPAHRAHLAALGQGRDVGDGRERPARDAAAEGPEHLVGSADDAELSDAVQVLLQLRSVLRLQRGLEDRVGHQRSAAAGERRGGTGRVALGRGRRGRRCRRGRHAGELLEPLQQQRQATEPLHEGREPPGCRVGRLLDARSRRSRDGLGGARLAVDDLHLGSERLAGLVQPGEPERQALAPFGRTGRKQQRTERAEVAVEPSGVDQLEVAHHVDLACRVEQQLPECESAPLHLDLTHAPGHDLPGGERGRQVQQQAQRVRRHERGDLVRQVLPKHVQRILELGGTWRAASSLTGSPPAGTATRSYPVRRGHYSPIAVLSASMRALTCARLSLRKRSGRKRVSVHSFTASRSISSRRSTWAEGRKSLIADSMQARSG